MEQLRLLVYRSKFAEGSISFSGQISVFSSIFTFFRHFGRKLAKIHLKYGGIIRFFFTKMRLGIASRNLTPHFDCVLDMLHAEERSFHFYG